MIYVRTLGLLAIGAIAVLALAGTASATKLTNPKGSGLGVGTSIQAVSRLAEPPKIDGSVTVACKFSTFEGSISNAGGEVEKQTQTVSVQLSSMGFSECGNDTVSVIGSFEGSSLELHSLGKGNATVTMSGISITFLIHRTVFGFPVTTHCIYSTNKTDIGTLTDSSNGETISAKLDVSSAPLPEIETDGACQEAAVLTGSYEITVPNTLYVD